MKITITLPGLHLWKWAALPLVAFALMLTWGHATAAAPPNDDIADAIPILELPFIHQVDTTDATIEGTDPFTFDVLGADEINMTAAIKEIGWKTERVTEPDEVIPALKRAFAFNNEDQPAYIEVICSQYPIYGDWAK